jgi:hypothetical protein
MMDYVQQICAPRLLDLAIAEITAVVGLREGIARSSHRLATSRTAG